MIVWRKGQRRATRAGESIAGRPDTRFDSCHDHQFLDHSCECLTCGWHCPLVMAWVIHPLARSVAST